MNVVYCIYKLRYIPECTNCTCRYNVNIRNDKVNSAIEIMQLKHVILICSKLTLSEYACEKLGHLQIAVAAKILKYMLVI